MSLDDLVIHIINIHTNSSYDIIFGKKKGGGEEHIDNQPEEELLFGEEQLAQPELENQEQGSNTKISELIQEKKVHKKNENIYSNIKIFKDDNFNDLRLKIYIAASIEPWRLHLYYKDKTGHHTTYDTMFEYKIEEDTEKLLNLPIDKAFYQNKNDIKIYDKEYFMTLGKALYGNKHEIFAYDINEILQITKIDIINNIDNKQIFENVYYGFIYKYFPWISLTTFVDLINGKNITKLFIPWSQPIKYYAQIYTEQEKILNKLYSGTEKIVFDMYIANAVFRTNIITPIKPLDYRIMFDLFHTSAEIPAVRLFDDELIYEKYAHQIDVPFPQTRHGILFAIKMAAEYKSSYIFVNLIETEIEITVKDNENKINFKNVYTLVYNSVNSLLKRISLNQELTKDNMTIKKLDVILIPNKYIDSQLYKELERKMQDYAKINLLKIKEIVPNKYMFLNIQKGITNYNILNLERKYKNIRNYYSRYLNDADLAKWLHLYSGRKVIITKRITDIQINIVNTDENDYIKCSEILAVALDTLSTLDYSKSNTVNNTMNKNIGENINEKKIRKLREVDPNLFDLSKYGDTPLYSVLCQEKKQPKIYLKNEIKNMSKRAKDKLTKLQNFTTGDDVYYECPTKEYPYFGFIKGKHPLGYLLPRCGKKEYKNLDKEIKNMKNGISNINETKKVKGNYIYTNNKKLSSGDLGFPPKFMTNCFIKGVSQNNNAGLLYSLVDCLGITPEDFYKKIFSNKEIVSRSTILTKLKHQIFQILYEDLNIDINGMNDMNPLIKKIASTYFNITIVVITDKETIARQDANFDNILYVYNELQSWHPIYLFKTDNKKAILEKKLFNINDNYQFIKALKASISDSIIDFRKCSQLGKITKYYVDLTGYCYGVLIEYKSNKKSFFPIDNIQTNMESLMYNPTEEKITSEDAEAIIIKAQKYFNIISVDALMHNKKYYGYKVNIQNNTYNIYFIPTSTIHQKINTIKLNTINTKYNYLEVNNKILNAHEDIKEKEKLIKQLNIGLYNNHLYILFNIQFITYIQSLRNTSMRTKISNRFKEKDFDLAIGSLKLENRDKQLLIFMYKKANKNKKDFLNLIQKQLFYFDMIPLYELSTMPLDKLKKELKKIMSAFIEFGNISNIQMPNILNSCSNNSEHPTKLMYCKNNKLIMDKTKYDGFLELMATDIKNPLKYYYFRSSPVGIINYYSFNKYENEEIKILQ
jgi:hypothetical protein